MSLSMKGFLGVKRAFSRRRFLFLLSGVCATFPLQSQLASDRGEFTLAGRVRNASGKHAVFVALWNAGGFLERPVRQIRIDPPAEPVFRFEVSSGRWALSAFEDVNGDGKLDMGIFGPKEPSGFWHPFHGWHKPHFDEVAFQIDKDIADAEIVLNK